MADFLAMEDGREHRQHRFYQHPRVPGATRTDFHINGIPALGMETHIGQDNHLRIKLRDQGLKMGFVCLASELDFGHVGNEPRQQLTWVTIGHGRFLSVGGFAPKIGS